MSHPNSVTTGAAGITGGHLESVNLKYLISIFGALAIWNAIELTALIFLTFAHYKGLYFWSLLVASLGIIPYTVGFMLKFFSITTGGSKWVSIALLTVGWYAMITGQSVVLWSRLRLMVSGESGRNVLTWTGWMIVTNVFILHVPTTVLTFGCNGSVQTQGFVRVFSVYEKLQMVGFFIQEVILSSIYILEAIKFLRTSLQPNTRKLLYQLFTINVLIIAGDISLLGVEFANMYVVEIMWKPVLYSMKLKLEFAVLGKLVKFVGGSQGERGRDASINFVKEPKGSRDANDISEFVDMSRINSDFTHASPTARNPSRPFVTDSDLDLARFEHIEASKSGSSA